MPTIIHMTLDIRVPVDPKDAISQMVATQALDTAANALRIAARERDGACIVMAQVKKVKDAPALTRGSAVAVAALVDGDPQAGTGRC